MCARAYTLWPAFVLVRAFPHMQVNSQTYVNADTFGIHSLLCTRAVQTSVTVYACRAIYKPHIVAQWPQQPRLSKTTEEVAS